MIHLLNKKISKKGYNKGKIVLSKVSILYLRIASGFSSLKFLDVIFPKLKTANFDFFEKCIT